MKSKDAADLFDWVAGDDEAHADSTESAERYQLMDLVGKGGMGLVRRAFDRRTDRFVAYKLMRPELAKQENFRQRFLREAEICAMLEHPHIMPVYDCGSDAQGQPYFTMKLLKGKSFKELLQVNEQKCLSASVALDILIKVSEAIGFAHQQGVIHRDLKADNIMIGDFGDVLVLDWGLAGRNDLACLNSSLAELPPTPSLLTAAGQGGTPAFMAPEQAMPDCDSNEAADIYALGGLLFRLLCEESPWKNLPQEEILARLHKGQAPALSKKPPAQQASLPKFSKSARRSSWALCRQALSADPTQRPASAKSFADELRRIRQGYAAEAEQASSLRLLSLSLRRHRSLALVCLLFLCLLEGAYLRICDVKQQMIAERERAESSSLQADKSRAEATLALKDLRSTAPVYLSRARESIRLGNFIAAQTDIELYMKLVNKNAEAYELLGRIKTAQLAFDDAREAFDKGLMCDSSWSACPTGIKITTQAIQSRNDDGKYSADALYIVYKNLVQNKQLAEAAALLDEILKNKDFHAQVFTSLFDNSDLKGELRYSKSGMLVMELNNSVKSIEPLRYFKQAQFHKLSLSKLEIYDLSPLRGLQIRQLELNHTRIANLDALKDNKWLRSLNCSGSKIQDINALADLELTHIDLSNCPLEDLRPLLALKHLKSLKLSSCPASKAELLHPLLAQLTEATFPISWRNRLGKIPPTLKITWSDLRTMKNF